MKEAYFEKNSFRNLVLALVTYFRSIDKHFTDSHIRIICWDYFIPKYILSEYS